MRRGAAAGMGVCPVNPVPNLRCVPQALCRHRIFIRRGAAAGMGLCPENLPPSAATVGCKEDNRGALGGR